MSDWDKSIELLFRTSQRVCVCVCVCVIDEAFWLGVALIGDREARWTSDIQTAGGSRRLHSSAARREEPSASQTRYNVWVEWPVRLYAPARHMLCVLAARREEDGNRSLRDWISGSIHEKKFPGIFIPTGLYRLVSRTSIPEYFGWNTGGLSIGISSSCT